MWDIAWHFKILRGSNICGEASAVKLWGFLQVELQWDRIHRRKDRKTHAATLWVEYSIYALSTSDHQDWSGWRTNTASRSRRGKPAGAHQIHEDSLPRHVGGTTNINHSLQIWGLSSKNKLHCEELYRQIIRSIKNIIWLYCVLAVQSTQPQQIYRGQLGGSL